MVASSYPLVGQFVSSWPVRILWLPFGRANFRPIAHGAREVRPLQFPVAKTHSLRLPGREQIILTTQSPFGVVGPPVRASHRDPIDRGSCSALAPEKIRKSLKVFFLEPTGNPKFFPVPPYIPRRRGEVLRFSAQIDPRKHPRASRGGVAIDAGGHSANLPQVFRAKSPRTPKPP